jgi:hypothetical protein
MNCPTRTVLILTALVSAGCGEEPLGLPVSGTVTLKGEPLDHGTIEFSPAAGQPTQSGTEIVDGKFAIPAANGLAPGLYDVRISSAESATAVTEEVPGIPTPPAKDRIPPEYNTRTTLQEEVKESAENKFEFKIP